MVGTSNSEGFDQRVLSRRKLLAWSGVSALGVVLGTQLATTPDASAQASSSPFSSSDEVRDLLLGPLGSALDECPLPVGPGDREASIVIVLAEPHTEFTIRSRKGRSEILTENVESDAGIFLSSATAHSLLIGAITPAFALADGRISLAGDRRELVRLHHLPSIARDSYVAAMTAAGKASWLSYDPKEVV